MEFASFSSEGRGQGFESLRARQFLAVRPETWEEVTDVSGVSRVRYALPPIPQAASIVHGRAPLLFARRGLPVWCLAGGVATRWQPSALTPGVAPQAFNCRLESRAQCGLGGSRKTRFERRDDLVHFQFLFRTH